MTLQLDWFKCADGNMWCQLSTVNLFEVDTFGVYVIWKPGESPNNVVRVGQGDIAVRVEEHSNDTEITQYGDDLKVTWAAVSIHQVDGVERYLGEQLSPLVGERFPDVPPIAVNLPAA